MPEPAIHRGPGLPEYAVRLAARHAAHRPELEALLTRFWGGAAIQVLDLACGDGFWTSAFERVLGPAASVTAVDVSTTFLAWAAARVAEDDGPDAAVQYVAADAERLPFPDGSFDVAWCAQSLISLPDPIAALRELRRVVRPGGTVAVLENDRMHELLLPWPVELELAICQAELGQSQGAEAFVARDLEQLFRRANLTPRQRVTLAIDRAAPLPTADAAFLQGWFHALRERVAHCLSPEQQTELARWTDPGSPAYLPNQPDFWMTWIDCLALAERE